MGLKLQKFSPVDREHPIIEVIDEEGAVLFDVSRNDEGSLEVCFHPAVGNRVLAYEQVVPLIEQAKARALEDD